MLQEFDVAPPQLAQNTPKQLRNMRARCKTPETSRLPSFIQRPAQAQVLEVHGATSVPSQVLRKVLEMLLETRGTPPLQLGLSGYRCRSSAARVAHLETANIK